MSDSTIHLGPILGVSEDNKYHVCILVNNIGDENINDIKLHIGKEKYCGKSTIVLDSFYWITYDFFQKPEKTAPLELEYYFLKNDKKLKSKNGEDKFSFTLPALNKELNIALVSCNGSDLKKASALCKSDYHGWIKLTALKPDLLVMAGDQIYADIIWKEIPNAKRALKSKSEVIDINLEREIDEFYLNLYIDSWTIPQIANALASIPTIMTWDDHDIIDGYGSLPSKYQNSNILKCIFKYAKKYYELFQVRGNINNLIMENYDYSYTLTWRNYHFVVPDTRSHRTRCNILQDVLYNQLEKKLKKPNNTINKLVFVLPVPIAHLKYHHFFESFIKRIFKVTSVSWWFTLRKSIDDDLLDHWEHNFHEEEQKRMLKLIFNAGINLEVKNLLIFSGDVHFGGAAKIEKKIGNIIYSSTQIISSPIVNKPLPNYLKKYRSLFSNDSNIVEDFTFTDFKEFGKFEEKIMNKRNFIIINDLKCHLNYEPWGNGMYYSRNLNKFK